MSLNEDSAIASQPDGLVIPLKQHQLAALHRCRLLEASCDGSSNSSSSSSSEVDQPAFTAFTALTALTASTALTVSGSSVHTRVGILADTVGSGKSLVVIALAWDSHTVTPPCMLLSSHGCHQVVLRSPEGGRGIRSSFVVVPHALVAQWRDYLLASGHVRSDDERAVEAPRRPRRSFAVVAQLRTVETAVHQDACDVVLVAASHYAAVVAALAQQRLVARRFVFDEADSLQLTAHAPPARFCWFVTASYSALLHPLGSTATDRTMRAVVLQSPFSRESATATAPQARLPLATPGLRPSTGYTRTLFKALYETAPPWVTRGLVVRCDDAFVQSSQRLPTLVHTVVSCRTPRAAAVLDGLVDRTVLQALRAGDETGALRLLVASGGRVVGSDESVVTLTMARVARQLCNAQCQLDLATGALLFDSDAERGLALAALTRKRDEIEAQHASLRARVLDSDTCPVCVETIRHKTVTPCCTNAYCMRCIHTWLSRRSTCPLCRGPLRVRDLVTVSEAEQPTCEQGLGPDKMAALEAVLERAGVRPTDTDIVTLSPSLLVFSAYDDLLLQASRVLTRAGLSHAALKGNGATVGAVVADFRAGRLSALLANVRNYGSGLNLEGATDVVLMHRLEPELERQVVGRAQRPGRTTPLHVWELR